MDHHVLDRELVELEQAAEHVAMAAFDAALLVQQVDSAAQLFLRSQHGSVLAGAQSHEAQHATDDRIDAKEHRRHHRDEKGRWPRDDKRHAIGKVDADRFRQNFREDQQQHGHDDCGVDDACVPEHAGEQIGQEGGCADVDNRVAEQHRADEPAA